MVIQSDLIEELDQGFADLASSLIAVARGGNPDNIVEQLQELAMALGDYRNIEGCNPPLDQIICRLRSLDLNEQSK